MQPLPCDRDQKVKLEAAADTPPFVSANGQAVEEPLSVPGLPERYRVRKILGQGGMGTVYQVFDQELKCDLAVKVMSHEWLSDDTALQRFEVEAAAVGELSHPHIAQVYTYSADGETPYITMEYVEGVSFDRVLKRERIIEEERLLNMVLQICDALEYAHLHGIVHRDLKPSNVILQDAGDIIKLVDFGIAKVGPKNDSATQLTRKGEVFGSPAYMSPEQAHAGTLDHRTDLYSLGCIIYEALCAKPLFAGDNAVQIMLQHINCSPINYTRKLLKKGYSKSLVAVIEKLLEKRPEQRYQSAAEAADDIRRVLNNQMSFALMKKPFLLQISKRGALTAAAVAGTIVLIGLCSLTAVMVARLQSDRPENQTVYGRMIQRDNEARDLMNKIANGRGPDVRLAARALRSLVCEDTWSPGMMVGPQGASGVPRDLLRAGDQQAILKAYGVASASDTKLELISVVAAMNNPTPDVIKQVCLLSRRGDHDTAEISKSAICRWASLVDKQYQAELSTALSYAALTRDVSTDPDSPAIGLNLGEETRALQEISEFSDEAVANIRKSAKSVPADQSQGTPAVLMGGSSFNHPLVRVAMVRQEYYPELLNLLKNKALLLSASVALQRLGPKALPAVADVCEMLKSRDQFRRAEAAAILSSIGPAAAPQAVPALTAAYFHYRQGDMAPLASALVKMGPSGIAFLRKQASGHATKGGDGTDPFGRQTAAAAAQDALIDVKP